MPLAVALSRQCLRSALASKPLASGTCAGTFDTVIDDVSQDVRTTLAVALESEKRGSFAWTTRKGTVSSMPLKRGWLTVEAALRLPLPETSWMSNPPSRHDFMAWLQRG